MIIYTCMAAASRDEICFNRFDDQEYDAYEPFGSVAFYTHGPEPKWRAIDMGQYIVAAIALRNNGTVTAQFASLSAEGEFAIYSARGVEVEKIVGAGIDSEGSAGYGRLSALRQIGHSLFACGAGGQVYVRRPRAGWGLLSRALLTDKNMASDYLKQVPSYGDFADKRDWENWISSHPLPKEIHLHDVNGHDENNIYFVGEGGFIGFWNGEQLVPLASVANHALTRILVEDERTVWICGRNGLLLRGNRHDGFAQISAAGSQAFLSMARYHGELYVASHANPSQLFVLDRSGGGIKPVLGAPEIDGLHTLAAVDDVLWAAGVTDIVRFDGHVWDYIYVKGMREIW